MSLQTIKTDMVRYEMRMVQGQDPRVRETHRPGRFSRFLSGLGRVLGGIAAPLSFIFPPAGIAAAAAYGVAGLGDIGQARANQRAAEKVQREAPQQAVFPGLEIGGMGIQPASYDLSARDRDVMNVLDSRGASMNQMSMSI
jgi:hypothetical protein